LSDGSFVRNVRIGIGLWLGLGLDLGLELSLASNFGIMHNYISTS